MISISTEKKHIALVFGTTMSTYFLGWEVSMNSMFRVKGIDKFLFLCYYEHIEI